MNFKSWLPTFLGFPLGGLVALETVGSLDGPLEGALGGLIAGSAIGAAQWLALRSHGIDARWIAHTAAAMAAGTAAAAALTGAGTDVPDLMLMGLLAGAAVGGAQSRLLGAGHGTWVAVTAASWPLGWLATISIGAHVEDGFFVFGAAGALLVTVLTGLALQRRPRTALAGAAS
jgi:hypothetical protein